MSELKLAGKVAVITGGNSGIGLATARLLEDEGARVVVIGRSQAALEKAQGTLGKDALVLQADVSKVDQIEQAMSRIEEAFGRIDVLFANAGIADCPPIQETDEAFFDLIMGINVKGVFFTFTHALPLLSEGASVVFTSSVANTRGRPGDPLYVATKAAVRSLARTLAADDEVLGRGIRVNVVSPGCIQTPLTAQDTPELQAAIDEYIEGLVPMRKWGQPEDVAKAVLYLACSDSSYLTGGEIAVDGGLGQI